jgi:hypothetical protein
MIKGIIKKLIKFIKIKILTKELEFKDPKIQKNMKTTKNSTPSASPYIYNDKICMSKTMTKYDIYKLILGF